MADSNFTQSSFLAGEWSPYAQGRIDSPQYHTAMNVCRNGYPLEEGAWIRRSGAIRGGFTLNGAAGRVISFDFEQATPYVMEFTDGNLRMWGVATQTSQLASSLPQTFRLVTTNDNVIVSSVSTANPAVVLTASPHGWSTGDQMQFLFATQVNGGFVPLLRRRTFTITVVDTTHFSIVDAITGAAIDGSTLGWANQTSGFVVAMRILVLATPYTGGIWSSLRKVQAEKQAVLLQGTKVPRNLQVTADPTASAFAAFSLSTVSFIDGPYLDPPTDGTFLTPTITAVSQGTLPVSGNWTAVAWNGSVFAALNSGTNQAATSPDGVTWTTRTLPSTSNWTAIAWNGSVFAAIASGTTAAATSPDGTTWTARTISASATWSAIAWNGTVFCAIASGGTVASTSPDGITWTARTLPASRAWSGIAWNGTVFCATNQDLSIVGQHTHTFTFATSPDGITWTSRPFDATGQPGTFYAIAWNGTVFCAPQNGGTTSGATVTSPDGINWSYNQTLPVPGTWTSIAWNGTVFCAVDSGTAIAATSPDGVAWSQQALPISALWDAIAAGGTTFCIVATGSIISLASTFASFSLVASSIASINSGSGFKGTDVGRSIRLRSEPLLWFTGTAYTVGQSVKFGGVYYTSIQNGTGKQPDISPSFWTISSAAATWTWGTIQTVTSASTVTAAIKGAAILYPTNPITTWRLGVYSDTTGYPTCGVYFQGRLWLSGAVANRVDASRPNLIFDMTPTQPDGTVQDNNAISYVFNSSGVNPIFWMIGQNAGIACGTQEGEWLIFAPTAGPITPTNIHASHDTHYGSANMEPEATQLTVSFVQRFNQTLLEFFPDALSGKYTAPNLSQNAKHLTTTGIQEIRYQQELLPIIWNRMGDGSLAGATYERDSLFSSQPAKFVGWHRHDFGNANPVESITVGPSVDGTVDTLAMVHKDSNLRHVEFMQSIFNVNTDIKLGWFVDDGIVPSGGVISGQTLTLYGLWDLNGKTATVVVAGVDCGDFAVTNGSVVVPIDQSPNELLTSAYLSSISSTSAYGAMATYIDGPGGRMIIPAVVGFTFTSQGQVLRPDTAEQTRSQFGVGLGLKRRIAQFAALLSNTQGISFGTDFNHMHPAQLTTAGGATNLTKLQLYSGVYQGVLDDTLGFDSRSCWQISRPYPSTVCAFAGRLDTSDQ